MTTDTVKTPTAYGYCSYHGGPAEDSRVIYVLDPRPGGVATAACPPCREKYRLVPHDERPAQ
jgi:hypothetical protein